MDTAVIRTEIGYDLASFDRRLRVREAVEATNKTKSAARAKTRAAHRNGVHVSSVLLGMLAFSMMIFMLFGNVRITQLADANQKLQSELTALREQEQVLAAAYEKAFNDTMIAKSARETYRMQPVQKSQITYVSMSEGDRTVLLSKQANEGTVIAQAWGALSYMVEYLR